VEVIEGLLAGDRHGFILAGIWLKGGGDVEMGLAGGKIIWARWVAGAWREAFCRSWMRPCS